MIRPTLIGQSIALVIGSLLSNLPAQAEERYMMDGKPVSQSMYEAVLLLKDGTIKLRANDNPGAIESFQHAESLAPEFPEVQHNLGIALAKVGKSKEAIIHLEKARTLNPNLASTWLSLGGLYQTEGRINDALSTYKQYLSKFPNDPAAAKVSSLVQGLSKEANLETQSNSLQNGNQNNYLNEITRQGVVRWSATKMPLRIYVAPGDSIPHYKPEYLELLVQSFNDWQKASNDLISFKFVKDKQQSDIQCTWTDNPKSLNNIAEAGETRLSSNSKGIVNGTIKFLTVPLMKALPLTNNRMRYIFLHEIGHVMGLAGHTNVPTDTMFYSMNLKDEWKDLSERDAKTIQMLYSQPESTISYKKGTLMSEGAHSHDHKLLARKENKGKLTTVLFITLGLMIAEVIVGIQANSLAILADAGHMLSDVGGLILALIAIWFSSKPATKQKTFGYYRSEILAGFINSIVLVAIAIFILYEAWRRLESPPEVNTTPVLCLAIIGIGLNILSLKILSSGAQSSLNMKAAYLEILADMLGLIAVVVSSLVIIFTGWHQADPLLSGLIAIMILPRTWMLLSECTHILMEGTPTHINLSDMYTKISSIDGVIDIHDLHVWTLTSDHHAMAAHVIVKKNTDQQSILAKIKALIKDEFEIHHSTIQLELEDKDIGKEDICQAEP